MRNERTTLVIQSFGRDTEYKRAILCILSYFAHSGAPREDTMVLLFTDSVDYFLPYLSGLPVEFILLTPEKIRSMRGSIDFLHRIKIAAIEEAFEISGTDLLYADSDTFFIADPEPLMRRLDETTSFMHTKEYAFDYLKDLPLPAGATFQAFYKLLKSQEFKLEDGNPEIPTTLFSWNAGVMMFHRSQKRFLPEVYTLTERFYPETMNHASEQYAFSVVLQNNTRLSACEEVIYHYWYRVKKLIIDDFLSKRLDIKWTAMNLETRLQDVKSWTRLLPHYFAHHTWTIRDNAIQAFNEDKFWQGYKWAVKALWKGPLYSKPFVKDVIYHLKRHLQRRKHGN